MTQNPLNLFLGTVVLCGGLALAGIALAAPPDFLYDVCVDKTDRTNVRAARNDCRDEATGEGYNVGIFRPVHANVACAGGLEEAPFICMGAPGKGAAAPESSEHFVLVHGAWHGSWAWHKVIAHLEEDGNRVTALNLPSHGIDDLQPGTITMRKYVQSVLDFLDSIREPVVLVGHSLGGMVITAVAEARPRKVELLVYVAAFLPASGQTLLDLSGHPDSLVGPALQFGPGFVDIDRDAVNDAFYGSSSEADRVLARLLLEPNPLAPFATPVFWTEPNFGSVPRAYVTTLEDRAIPLPAQLAMIAATPVWRVAEIDSDHSPFFSAAEELSEHLKELIEELDED